jgi:hypothetical protein
MNKSLPLEIEHLSPYGPCWGNVEGGTFTGDFERQVRFCFIRRPFYWGLREICKRRLWNRATFPTWAPLGDLEGVSFTRDLEKY